MVESFVFNRSWKACSDLYSCDERSIFESAFPLIEIILVAQPLHSLVVHPKLGQIF
jgi:hypothetical protein